ncbi:hypothetical protein [Marinobacter sp.]|uniref:hypothetical protein n=1 Tax=Marinobacter sp. TaxID=50741 RepID=UPI00261D1B16|nr:hypothetical protein [Marinobacter sp.]
MASDAHEERTKGGYREGRARGITSIPALRIIDNQTGDDYFVRDKTPEQIAQAFQHILLS